MENQINRILGPYAVSISAEQQAENRQLIQAVHAVNAPELFGKDSELTFAFDRTARRAVIRLVNRKTGKEIRILFADHWIRVVKPGAAYPE